MGRGLQFPFAVGDLGVPAGSTRGAIVRQQLEQLLFTMPGERVGRPGFGCGVQRLVFSGADTETAAAAEYTVLTAIRSHMRDIIEVEAVRVSVDDTTLFIDVLFTLIDDGTELAATFSQPLQGAP